MKKLIFSSVLLGLAFLSNASEKENSHYYLDFKVFKYESEYKDFDSLIKDNSTLNRSKKEHSIGTIISEDQVTTINCKQTGEYIQIGQKEIGFFDYLFGKRYETEEILTKTSLKTKIIDSKEDVITVSFDYVGERLNDIKRLNHDDIVIDLPEISSVGLQTNVDFNKGKEKDCKLIGISSAKNNGKSLEIIQACISQV